jgi:hypothetical protein
MFEFPWKPQDYLLFLPIVVSCVAIVVTLTQVSLLRRQLRLDALIKIIQSNRELLRLGFDKPSLWEYFQHDRDGVTDKASQEERRRYFQLWLNHMHVIWKAHKTGLYDHPEWQCAKDDMAQFFRVDSFKRHWEAVERYYPKAFRREMLRLNTKAGSS